MKLLHAVVLGEGRRCAASWKALQAESAASEYNVWKYICGKLCKNRSKMHARKTVCGDELATCLLQQVMVSKLWLLPTYQNVHNYSLRKFPRWHSSQFIHNLQKLEQIDICVLKKYRFYPYHSCYDFEAYLARENLPKNGPKLVFEAIHVLMSVEIVSNVSGFEERKCFITSGDEKKLIQNLINYLKAISLSAYQLLKKKFQHVFEALENSKNVRKENLLKEFDSFCKKLIVLEFNSLSYDLNLVKPILIEHLLKQIDFVIKKANTYLCIKA